MVHGNAMTGKNTILHKSLTGAPINWVSHEMMTPVKALF